MAWITKLRENGIYLSHFHTVAIPEKTFKIIRHIYSKLQAMYPNVFKGQLICSYLADTLRNNDIVITPKRCHFDVIISKWRCFYVKTTLLFRQVFGGYKRNKNLAHHLVAAKLK